MNRARRLVRLAKNGDTDYIETMDQQKLAGSGTKKDSRMTHQMSCQEKVYHYLHSLESRSNEEPDPYAFTETDDIYSPVDTDNFPIQPVNCNVSLSTSTPHNSYFNEERSTENKLLENSTVADVEVDKTSHQTYIPISNQEIPIKHFDSDKKICILDYKIFPPKTVSKFDDNNNESYMGNAIPPEPVIFWKETFQSCSDDHSSDVDYIPSSNDTDNSSSNEDIEQILCAGIKNETTTSIRGHENLLEPTSENLPLSTTFTAKDSLDSSIKTKLKRDLCPFCFEEIDHFARHLIKKHSDEEEIKVISKLPLKSNERRIAIMSLRKKGNFILHEQKNKLKVVRLPNKNSNKEGDSDYFPCVNCLGFYKRSYLWRHKKICKSKVKSGTSSKNHLTESQTFLATTGMLGNVLNKGRIKKEVFSIMRPDSISYTVKTDSLICLFGESYINKHKRKQINTVVSNKMRELARLKIAIKNSSTIEHLIDVLKPECYELIVAATKLISGYNVENRTYNASSLALHMGTSLKFLCDVATKAILTKNPLFLHINKEEKLREIKDLRYMINMHWCNDVSSLANKVLNEEKFLRPKLLPFTEDIKALNVYVRASAERAYNNLKGNIEIKINYKILTECTLILVLIFNRKRVGEVQFLNITTYNNNNFSLNQKECLSSLSELERNMSSTFKRVVVFGKGSKPVPILFTKVMQRYIEMILSIRNKTEVVPKSNPYLFANPDSKDRWMTGPSVLRKYAHNSGAQNPDLLTSTRFRKQLATILQLMNFENDEMEQIARFMGHNEKTHKEFYRLTDDIYQTAKVAKVLLLLNAGKGSEFKGKSLEEIEVADDVLEYDEKEEETVDVETKSEEKKETTDIEETYEEKQEEETYEEKQEETYEEKQEETYEKKQEEEDSSDYISGNKRKQKNEKNEAKNMKVEIPNMRKCNRVRWVIKDKQLVIKYFKNHIKSKTVPKKQECLNFINEHTDLFSISDWVRIKTLVFNTYRDK